MPRPGTARSIMLALLVCCSPALEVAAAWPTLTKVVDQEVSFAGEILTYTIVAHNSSSVAIDYCWVEDTFSFSTYGCTWTCEGAGGGQCIDSSAGSGSFFLTIFLPIGSTVTIQAECIFAPIVPGGCATNHATLAGMDPDFSVPDSATTCDWTSQGGFADGFESGDLTAWSAVYP